MLSHKIFFALALVLGAISLDSQIVRSPTSAAVAHHKANLQDLPALDLASGWSRRGEPSSPTDSARAGAYSGIGGRPLYDAKTGKFLIVQRSVNRFEVSPLPTKSSDVVVIGKITEAQTRLSADGEMVYTKYSFIPQQFLKSSGAPTLTPFVVDRIGGVVSLPDGKRRFVGDTALGLPVPGHEYLLFLTVTKVPTVFEISTGYAINAGVVSPLDEFNDKMDGKLLADVVEQIKTSK